MGISGFRGFGVWGLGGWGLAGFRGWGLGGVVGLPFGVAYPHTRCTPGGAAPWPAAGWSGHPSRGAHLVHACGRPQLAHVVGVEVAVLVGDGEVEGLAGLGFAGFGVVGFGESEQACVLCFARPEPFPPPKRAPCCCRRPGERSARPPPIPQPSPAQPAAPAPHLHWVPGQRVAARLHHQLAQGGALPQVVQRDGAVNAGGGKDVRLGLGEKGGSRGGEVTSLLSSCALATFAPRD